MKEYTVYYQYVIKGAQVLTAESKSQAVDKFYEIDNNTVNGDAHLTETYAYDWNLSSVYAEEEKH